VTKNISVPGGTTLANLASNVQGQLPAGLHAAVEDGRLTIRATDDAIKSVTFSGVNAVAQAVFGFANTQPAIPFFNFVNFQELQTLIDNYLPGPFSFTYDTATKSVGLDLDLYGSTSASFNLDFDKTLDLGPANISLAGAGEADVAAKARLKLAAAFDLAPLTTATWLKDLNGGKGLRTNGTSASGSAHMSSRCSGAIAFATAIACSGPSTSTT
jgi:hypothetical protein